MRRLVWIPLLVLTAAGLAAFDERSGIPAWRRLRGDLVAARARIDVLQGEIEALRREAAALDGEPFAIERAIREDLGLARPGESVVRLGGAGIGDDEGAAARAVSPGDPRRARRGR